MKKHLLVAAILFSLFLALPIFQMATGLPPDYVLQGVENKVVPPNPGWAAWWNGTLQAEVDAWLNQRIGLRGLLVRTANQVNFTLVDW